MRNWLAPNPIFGASSRVGQANRIYANISRSTQSRNKRYIMERICRETSDKYVAEDVFSRFFPNHSLQEFDRLWSTC